MLQIIKELCKIAGYQLIKIYTIPFHEQLLFVENRKWDDTAVMTKNKNYMETNLKSLHKTFKLKKKLKAI